VTTATDTTLAVVRTGTANTASVLAAFRRLGMTPVLLDDAESLRRAERVVLPGVGSFAAGRAALDDASLVEVLQERLAADRPTLAVCLGMQLLCETSEESPGVPGLGCIPGRVTRFPSTVRSPQLGWSRLEAAPGARLLADGYVYFAHGYRLLEAPAGWSPAWSEHGDRFVAAVERGAVLACQFHPELSGRTGRELLTRWLEV